MLAFNVSLNEKINSTPMKLAGSIIVLMPILILFIAFQRRIISNISMGGLKE